MAFTVRRVSGTSTLRGGDTLRLIETLLTLPLTATLLSNGVYTVTLLNDGKYTIVVG